MSNSQSTAPRFPCSYCGEPARKPHKGCTQSFCSRRCCTLSRRQYVPKAVRVAEKAAYDRQYREKNREMLKAKKRAYFQRTYDPVKAAVVRKKRMPLHVAYCRQPRYKAYKKAYDQKRRDSQYGPFAEAARLAINLNRAVKERMSPYEIRIANQTLNKRQARHRSSLQVESRDRHSRAQGQHA